MGDGGGLPGRLAREPLVHFLAAGALLFAAFQTFGTPEAETDGDVIVVDRAALLAYMQYRVNAFEPELFGAALDAMTEAERAALVEEYASEEALYRESQALGLAESDYIIRQRMIQKLEFLLGEFGEAGAADEAALAAYFEANREAYAVEPAVTFTHVFFDVDRRGEVGAEAAAREAVAALNAEAAGFNDAPGRGDRFPFLTNYVERTIEYVASHFGEDFARAVGAPSASEGAWVGPIRSAFGWHAVLQTRRTERRLPALEEVREDVERDFSREQSEEALAEMTRSLRERYRVVVDLEEPEPAP
jgi:parvulin-like peptidyl-prolyl isomerase